MSFLTRSLKCFTEYLSVSFLDRSIILHLRLMMVLMIICYFYAFFFADIISLLCSLKAFELLLSIKAGLNYANTSKSHHFLQAQRLLNQQIWYICQNCLSNYIYFFSLSNISLINLKIIV